MGSTTTYGAGAYSFSLPFTVATVTGDNFIVSAYVYDSSTTTFYLGVQSIASAGSGGQIRTHANAAAISSTVPMTFATSDQIDANGTVIINN